MNLSALDDFDAEDLREYIRALLWQYRLVDAFWFLKAEDGFGLAKAEGLNAAVWEKVSELSARDLVDRFGPFPPGLDGFIAALRLFPWSFMVHYEMERAGDVLTFSVAHCPAQEGRRKHHLPPYACKDMHTREFTAFARVIDPAIRVTCLYAPPDPASENLGCRWRFTLLPEGNEAA